MQLGLEVVGRSDVGRVRPSNEDSFGFDLRQGIFVVCDGMGGHAAGEVASKIAVDTVLSYFRDKEPLAADASLADAPLGAQMLSDAVNKANETILDYAEGHATASGMGTTLVAARFAEGKFTIAHVGDSRIYLLREGSLLQLTEDHSLVMEQVRRGIISIEEAERSKMQNVILRALGTEESVDPDLADHEFVAGDVLLLCSDGLSRYVKDGDVLEVVRRATDLDRECEELIALAKAGGSDDNITCMLLRAVEQPWHERLAGRFAGASSSTQQSST